jgi:hypothetical protein
MSNFIIEIEQETHLLEIETTYSESFSNIEVERYETFNIDIINTEKLLASDLPDDIPMSKIIGNLHVSRIDNLDDYLSEIDVDGGSP